MSPHHFSQIYRDGLLVAPFRNDAKNVSRLARFSHGCWIVCSIHRVAANILEQDNLRCSFSVAGVLQISVIQEKNIFLAQIENYR